MSYYKKKTYSKGAFLNNDKPIDSDSIKRWFAIINSGIISEIKENFYTLKIPHNCHDSNKNSPTYCT